MANEINKNKKFTSVNCWTDGSGFEFDGEPVNLIGRTSETEHFFSLTGRMAKNSRKGWNLWSNWVDKFQIDNRFLLLSDENAEAVLHPNVDDPWMFTEYIFKGIGKEVSSKIISEKGKDNKEVNKVKESLEDVDFLIVEPPLYDEETLTLINPDRIFPLEFELNSDGSNFKYYDIKNECASYNQNRIIDKNYVYVKSCRTIDEKGWGEGYPVNDPGVKLYRVSVNVESVKWGEHGNIPPHTLNMYSPPSWLDTKTKKTIQPITVAKIGYPVYATADGVFYHAKNNFDYIIPLDLNNLNNIREEKHPSNNENLTKFYYDIPEEKDIKNGVMQPKGKAATSVETSAKKNEMILKYIPQCQNGDLVYKGMCEFFSGQGGCAYCSLADENDMELTNSLKLDIKACCEGNENCPKYMKKPQIAISTYEAVARTKDQYYAATYGLYGTTEEKFSANALLASSVGGLGFGLGFFAALGAVSAVTTYYQPGLRDYTEKNVYFETTFKVIETPAEDFEITESNDLREKQSSKGVRVVRGSGNQNIDNIIPWKGGDSYAVGDADQVNFARFTQSVMPCYNPDYCNEFCGLAMQSGYTPESRAGSNTQNSPDADGEFVDYCRYYKNKKSGVECPFDSIPKTAYEFQEAQIIGGKKLEAHINQWISSYSRYIQSNNIVFEEDEMFVLEQTTSTKQKYFFEGKEIPIEDKKKYNKIEMVDVFLPTNYTLYSKIDKSAEFGGLNCSQTEKKIIQVPTKKEDGGYQYDSYGNYITTEEEILAYKICKFTLTSINPQNANVDELFFWWSPFDNNGNKIYKNGKEVIWFCKYDRNLIRSSHFTHYVDNWNKFIGGSHPFYKDYSKRGGEYIQEKDGISLYERDDGMGDLGGDPEYSGIEEPKIKRGYWIDEDGEWILDELPINNSLKHDENGKELTPITKKITTYDRAGRKKEQTFSLTKKEWDAFNNKNERENTSGTSLSFRKSNTEVSPEGKVQAPQTINCSINLNDTAELIKALTFDPPTRIDEKGEEVKMPPHVNDETALPAERQGAYCSVCDYYLNEKYGTKHGSTTEGIDCPWCGNPLKLQKPIKKLHKQKAIGKVDYWGLPGTVIDSKSYFWKSPTLINNTMLDQIKFKIKKNASNTNSDTELTQGHTFDYKGYYKPIPSQEEVKKMPEKERKAIWERVKEKDRENYSMYNDLIDSTRKDNKGFDTSTTNNQLIAPYSETNALRFFTLKYLMDLRAAVEPAMGYVIGSYPSNPDYERMRPTYENRTEATATRYWTKGKCGVKPVILAGNTTGRECFIQFWSGSPEVGAVRMYFPPGLTWWFNNKCMGLRYSNSKGTSTHLDTGTYGDETRSMMCCFLHGFLPLNKEILAAYAIINPGTVNPSRAPLGLDWSGLVFYQHYHAFTRPKSEVNIAGDWHETLGRHLHKEAGYKYWVYDNVGDMIPWSAVGQPNRELYKKIWEKPGWWNEAGDGVPNKNCYWIKGYFQSSNESKYNRIFFNEDGIPHYVKKQPQIDTGIKIIKNEQIGEFKDDGRYPEWVEMNSGVRTIVEKNKYQSYYDFNESTMRDMTSDLNHYFDEEWWGKTEDGEPVWDYIKLEGQYEEEEGVESDWTKWGKDIIQLKTSNEIWKQLTSKEFDECVEINTCYFNLCCSDGEIENSRDFITTNKAFIKDFYPEQMQEIPGYFNYKGMNSALTHNANTRAKQPEVDEKWSNEQILYQDDNKNSSTISAGLAVDKKEYFEAGCVPVVLNITDVVKKAYEERVEREFVCKAGKPLSYLVDNVFPESEWRGTGDEPSEWRDTSGETDSSDRKKWNFIYKAEDEYLLSNDWHYPLLNSENKVIKSTNGDKMKRNTVCLSSVHYSKIDNITIMSVDDNLNKIELTLKVYDSPEQVVKFNLFEEKEFVEAKEIKISFEEYCRKAEIRLNENGVNCTISTYEKQVVIKIEGCDFFTFNGESADIFGVNGIEFRAAANRVVSSSSNIFGYSPLNLIYTSSTKDLSDIADRDTWKTDSFIDDTQFFIVDLCQIPLEIYRKDWRYREGTKNYSNCVCSNEYCATKNYTKRVGSKLEQVTVGEWAAMKNIRMSDGQSTCPSCGSALSEPEGAVVAINSDGIASYYYDDIFEYDSFITEIFVQAHDDKIFQSGFNVYCQNSESGVWVCVAIINVDENGHLTNTLNYNDNDNNNDKIIKEIKINDLLVSIKFNFSENNNFRARYVKIETKNKKYRENYGLGLVEAEFTNNTITTSLHQNILTDILSGQVIRFDAQVEPDKLEEWRNNGWTEDEETTNDIRIITNYIQDNKLIIKLDKNIPENATFCQFYVNKYRSGIRNFSVWGYPFKKTDITITPPPDYEVGNNTNGSIKLSQQPIQIMKVCCGSTSSGMIRLEYVNSVDYKLENLFFTTTKKTYKVNKETEITYYEINGGNCWYNPKENKIHIPQKAKIGNEEIIPVSELTKELEENNIFLKINDVSQIFVEYWSASNTGLTLEAEAAESGPSYQLEAESICVIRDENKLPSCGKSVPVFNPSELKSANPTASIKDIKWICYNHTPSTLKEKNQTSLGGYFRKPTFYGTELGAIQGGSGSNNAKKFIELFGECCTNITPSCFAEVTFYGKPNTVLSGDIVVKAPKENTKTYEYDGDITYTEKTGGLKNGSFVLEIRPSEKEYKNKNFAEIPVRKTVAWENPYIVVFAKDKNPFSSGRGK